MLSALLAPPGSFSYLSFFSFSFRLFDLFDISSFISICTFPFSTLSSPSHFHFHFPLSSLIYLHHLTFLLRAFRPFCLSSFHLVILSSCHPSYFYLLAESSLRLFAVSLFICSVSYFLPLRNSSAHPGPPLSLTVSLPQNTRPFSTNSSNC